MSPSNAPMKMSRAKPKLVDRIMPWLGASIIVMGTMQVALTLSKSGDINMRTLGTGLLISSGGLSLVARRFKLTLPFFVFVGGALSISYAIVVATQR